MQAIVRQSTDPLKLILKSKLLATTNVLDPLFYSWYSNITQSGQQKDLHDLLSMMLKKLLLKVPTRH